MNNTCCIITPTGCIPVRTEEDKEPLKDMRENVHGYWKGNATSAFNVYCSVCGHECGVCFKFCPYCGAIMDGDDKS